MTHIPLADPRRKATRLSVERLSDGFGVRTRVMPVVETMQRRGILSDRQAHAASRIYACWALGICGARDADSGGNGSDPGGYTDRQMDAAKEYRKLRNAVGVRLWPIVWHIACDDWSVERFANECGGGLDRKQWMGCLKLALDTAADHLGLPD
jgi:hypothetical protein